MVKTEFNIKNPNFKPTQFLNYGAISMCRWAPKKKVNLGLINSIYY